VYALTHPAGRPSAADAAMTAVQLAQRPAPAPAADANAAPRPPVTIDPNDVPVWPAAEAAFRKRDYDTALSRYGRLLLASRKVPADALAGDFFQLRVAQCLWQLGRLTESRRILANLSSSGSPVVRAAANVALGRMDEAAGQFLQARMRAYRGLAALGAMETSLPLVADCDYLAARALTRKVGGFHSAEEFVPFSRFELSDVVAGRDEASLERLLEDGAAELNPSVLSPEVVIRPVGQRWAVRSWRASLEDLLHQFAGRIGKDIQWHEVAPAVRRRKVTFCLREGSEQRVCEVACGVAGLAARFTWDQVVVYDPQSLSSVSQQGDLLRREAASAWRRFALRFPDDRRVAEGQFALAALEEWAGETVAAMRQYQLIGRRYQKALSLAPRALMRSATLRIQLRDYAGARTDLMDLLDTYPGFSATDEVYLQLARVNMSSAERDRSAAQRGAKLDEAIRIFRKVYYLNTGKDSRRDACLGAGECHYRKGEYKDASEWLTRYLKVAEAPTGRAVAQAYLLLGKAEAAQGHNVVAAEAFRRVLGAKPGKAVYVEAVLALTDAKAEAEDFVGAIGVLRRIEAEALTPEQTYRRLLAVSRLYRRMGLPDRARAELRRKASSVTDPSMRAVLAVEMARCLRESGELRAARQALAEAVPRLSPGPHAWQASLDLAAVCLETGESDRAAIVCRELLRDRCGEATRREALAMLSRAYLQKKDYGKAAETLARLDQGGGTRTGTGKGTSP
jgi:tetratricopeptide (TPR) repeat protein